MTALAVPVAATRYALFLSTRILRSCLLDLSVERKDDRAHRRRGVLPSLVVRVALWCLVLHCLQEASIIGWLQTNVMPVRPHRPSVLRLRVS